MPEVNLLAVVAAAVSAFVLGGLWYSPALFGAKWARLTGKSDEELKSGSMAKIFGGAFLLNLLSAWVFAMFLGPKPGLHFGAGAGLAAGLCWVATAFAVNDLFERRPIGLTLINGGYVTVQFLLIGAVIGLLG